MVLLPQHAPYTDHLGVLVCGGASTGHRGINNCISTQPGADNPTWTIERMPSERVMPCMAGLPDGTYLILNGAYMGAAGFGIASSPNYNAVIYDPTKPVNHRMSVMANTTVARLYHSEATLLLDGRVLVSGSDPTGQYPTPQNNYQSPVNDFPVSLNFSNLQCFFDGSSGLREAMRLNGNANLLWRIRRNIVLRSLPLLTCSPVFPARHLPSKTQTGHTVRQ